MFLVYFVLVLFRTFKAKVGKNYRKTKKLYKKIKKLLNK